MTKQQIIDFLQWIDNMSKTDPFALETENDDIADMYLEGYYQ